MAVDMVIKGNAVWTGLEKEPCAGGIAISGNKIVAVEKGDAIDAYIEEGTKVYEYGDNLIMPGMGDSHMHLILGAAFTSEYFLHGLEECHSEEEVCQRVKEFADAHPDFEKIAGFGFFTGKWDDPLTPPTKASLDAVVPDRPVYLTTVDVHSGWMNSKALEQSGIRKGLEGVAYPEEVAVDENGEPTGMAFENGWLHNGFKKFIYFSDKADKEMRLRVQADMNKWGQTFMGEMSGHLPGREMDYPNFRKMADEGTLTLRIAASIPMQQDGDYTEWLPVIEKFEGGLLSCPDVKMLMDGVTTTHTAAMMEPYDDDPTTCGEPLWSFEEFRAGVLGANKLGLAARLHAIGDKSVKWALDIYEEAEGLYECKKNRIRNGVEHIETCRAEDIPRFGELDVVAHFQPEHAPGDMHDQDLRIGVERGKTSWPWNSILQNGGVLGFGSDYPVVPPNPFAGIYFAITRLGYDGKPFSHNHEQEKVTLYDALRAYTYGCAYGHSMEDQWGTLAPGMLADVTVINRNLFECTPDEIREAEASLTVLDGKVVYEA